MTFHCGPGHTCKVNVGKRWEGELAGHRAPRAGVGAAIPPPPGDRSLESVIKRELDQHRSPRQATCLHGAAGTQECNCVFCMF